jgi:putative ABC transport system permease protein
MPALTIEVRTAAQPETLAPALRAQVASLDAEIPVFNVRTMEQIVAVAAGQPRFQTVLLVIFSAIALLLAAIGLYGVMSFLVRQRTHEIGLRMALGAQPRDVMGLVIKQGLLLTLIGIGIGLAAAFGLTRLMKSLLFEVSATDPLTFAVIAALLATVALLACYIPARRAMKVDPMVALRYE